MDAPDDITRFAEPWARTILTVLGTEFPYAAAHVSMGPDDVDVSPRRLHPAFHGSFDWHSSAHMQWSACRLLESGQLSEATAGALVAELDARLTHEACAVEADYLRAHPRFERPYGWAWAAMLAGACGTGVVSRSWAASTRPLFDSVASLVHDWLPRLAYPVRQGEHANTAFGLALVHEAATALGETDLVVQIADQAQAWFGEERDYPAAWEPGGSDFLSPALCQADLMRRVDPDGFAGWLQRFLPTLGEGDLLLGVPEVRDRTDGKAVHLSGLALSRAWQLRLIAPHLPAGRGERVRLAADRQVAAVEQEIVAGDFMSTHWLVSFALLAASVPSAGPSSGPSEGPES